MSLAFLIHTFFNTLKVKAVQFTSIIQIYSFFFLPQKKMLSMAMSWFWISRTSFILELVPNVQELWIL